MCYGFNEKCDNNNNNKLLDFMNTTLHYILQSGWWRGKNTIISTTHQIHKQPPSCEKDTNIFTIVLFHMNSIDYIFVLPFIWLISKFSFFFQVVWILSILNLTTPPLWKLCAKCHVSECCCCFNKWQCTL